MGILDNILTKIAGATHAPTTGAQVAAPAAAQAPPSILGTIGSVLAPEAGSFWSSALQNGLVNARPGMEVYQAEKAKAAQEAQAAATKAARGEYITTPQGAVLQIPTEGGAPKQVYTPPVKPTETESLIEKWLAAPEGSPIRALYERAIKGYQYTEPVIERQTKAKERVVATNNKTKRFAPRAAGKAAQPGPGEGFTVTRPK